MNIKKQIILLIGSGIVTTILLVVFLICPLFIGIKEDSNSLVSVKKELNIISDTSGEIETAKTACSQIDSYLEKAENLFVDMDVPVRLIEFLEDRANRSNLDINISPTSLREAKDDVWEFVGFRLNLAGRYNNFVKFLKHVEAGPFLIEVNDMSIKTLSESELNLKNYEQFSIGDITAILTIKVFAKQYED